MASTKISLTTAMIKNFKAPTKGRDYYYDEKEKGLVVDVTKNGKKSFYLYKKVHGHPLRIFIGDAGEMSITEAREQATKYKSDLKNGINPNEEKSKIRKEITLKELYHQFMERYSKKMKKSWKYDEYEIPKFLGKWFNRKISDISKLQVQKLHEHITEENGPYQANRVLERLKSMYNRAIEWGWDGVNPCIGVKKNREIKRDRFIYPEELPSFFEALSEEENQEAKNYILISLYTGARKSNVLAMRWDDIDWELGIWRIPETKNGEPVNVPLIDPALKLLNSIEKTSEWVFPSPKSASGHLQDPKKAWKRILDKAGIKNLRIHDIRRTLGSYLAITGASLPVIGKTLGHKSQTATQIYARLTNDPVRKAIEIAANKILEYKNKE